MDWGGPVTHQSPRSRYDFESHHQPGTVANGWPHRDGGASLHAQKTGEKSCTSRLQLRPLVPFQRGEHSAASGVPSYRFGLGPPTGAS